MVIEKKQELIQHRKITDLKEAISNFRDYAVKIKIKMKQYQVQMNDGSANKELGNLLHGKAKRVEGGAALKPKVSILQKINDVILPVDLEYLRNEISDLEARIQHKQAMLNIEKYIFTPDITRENYDNRTNELELQNQELIQRLTEND